jgi:hypothetical protein
MTYEVSCRMYVGATRALDQKEGRNRKRAPCEALKRLQTGEWPAPSTVIDLYGNWAAAVADAFGGA